MTAGGGVDGLAVDALRKLVEAVRAFADGDMSDEVRNRLYLSRYDGPEQKTYSAMCTATDEAASALAALEQQS